MIYTIKINISINYLIKFRFFLKPNISNFLLILEKALIGKEFFFFFNNIINLQKYFKKKFS